MIVVVSGGRRYAARSIAYRTLDDLHAMGTGISLVVQGGARGADRFAKDWADMREIPCLTFPAKWSEYGISAGPRRNIEMFEFVTRNFPKGSLMHLSFPGGKGTEHAKRIAEQYEIPIVTVRNEDDHP